MSTRKNTRKATSPKATPTKATKATFVRDDKVTVEVAKGQQHMTLAQARKGKVPGNGIDTYLTGLEIRTRLDANERAVLLYDTALAFHAVVTVGKRMNGKQFAEAISRSKQQATFYKRLGEAADRFGVRSGELIWRYLSQKADTAQVTKALAIEDNTKALAALKSQAAEWDKIGKVSQGNGQSTRRGGNPKTPKSKPADIGDLLKGIESWLSKADDADVRPVLVRIEKMAAHRRAALKPEPVEAATGTDG